MQPLISTLILLSLKASIHGVLSFSTEVVPGPAASYADVRSHHHSDSLTERNALSTAVCTNAPGVVAGTVTPSSLPARRTLPKRRSVWCIPSSSIYIVITTITASLQGTAIRSLLDQIIRATTQRLSSPHQGDGPLDGGDFLQLSGGATFIVHEMVGQTLTYGVLQGALSALQDFMRVNGYQGVNFEVWDGAKEVGEGMVMAVVNVR